jgi:hypothetical protein
MPKVPSPRLYKYLDVKGALLTLRNRTFKHSKPSEFNDKADLTIESLFPEADETALAAVWDRFTEIIVKNIDRTPSCLNEAMRDKVAQIQGAFRQHPDKIELIIAEAKNLPVSEIYDLERMKERTAGSINEINDFLQTFRILCVSEKPDSMRMWSRYAQEHKGVVLRIVPNLQKDSKFTRFRAVKYQERRPPLYDDPVSYLEAGLFEDQDERGNALLDKVVYAKTLEWEYEQEQRLAIPIIDEANWNVMPFHSEEISEVFLGANMTDDVRREIVTLAVALNPEITIFQAVKGSTEISFFLVR